MLPYAQAPYLINESETFECHHDTRSVRRQVHIIAEAMMSVRLALVYGYPSRLVINSHIGSAPTT